VRDRLWFQVLAVLALALVIGLVIAWRGHHDVVADWRVLGTCTAAPGTAPDTVSTTLDMSACAAPGRSLSSRGWPIVAFVLDGSAGLDPRITAVLSDPAARTMRVEYDAATSATGAGGDVVLAYIEVPPESLPSTPFTIEGASGPVTVHSVTTG
jgi:hypothetical protein